MGPGTFPQRSGVRSRLTGKSRRAPSLTVLIRRARHRDGYSIAKIARQFSVSPYAVKEVLSGREPPGRKAGRVD
jgi:hypothetical protein